MPRVIALTGATGFIGTAVLNRLRSAGFQVRALYRTKHADRREPGQRVQWVPGRLEDSDSLERLLKGVDTIIHCAGAVRGAEWRQFKAVNTDGVARMVHAAKQMHPSPRFLLLSSLAAREPGLSHYAASKRQGEDLLKCDMGGLEWVALRPPAVYGPGDSEITPLFRLMYYGVAPQATPETSRFAMIYIDDLVEAILTLVGLKGWPNAVFELNDGRSGGYSWSEIVQSVARALARPVCRFRIPPFLLRSIAIVNQWAGRVFGYAPMLSRGKVRELEHADWTSDNTAIAEAAGWQPRIGLEEGIHRTLVFLGLIPAKPTRKTKGPQHADI
jgi:nucleoside-diphosphate-sugar epimerase